MADFFFFKYFQLGVVSSFFRRIFSLQTLYLICRMTASFQTVMLAILIETLVSPNLILILSLHLYYTPGCYASSHCSKSVGNKIFNILVKKVSTYRSCNLCYLLQQNWLLIILSSKHLMEMNKVFTMFGIILWNILCPFKCTQLYLEHK